MTDWTRQNRKVIVPTIMHSGSRILRDRVLEGVGMVAFHLTECDRFHVELQRGPIFTSLRHPALIWESFKRRAAKRNRSRYPYNQETFDWQWREMIDRISKLKPFYLHVDAPDIREKQVERMEAELGRELSKDFSYSPGPKDGFTGTHDLNPDDLEPVSQEYVDFYYASMK